MGTFPDELREKLNEKLAKGYELVQKGNYAAGCDVWAEAWKIISEATDSFGISDVCDFDDQFLGVELIYNWGGDYEMELSNAARDELSYAERRIEFCSEFSKLLPQGDPNILNMKRAVAESYFSLGQADEGERLFEEYLHEDPTWGWGWIGWSDMYSFFGREEDKDSTKAIEILKRALLVEKLEDRAEVQQRLKHIYLDLGMQKEADAIIIKRETKKKKSKPAMPKQTPVTVTKIGRNDPCPCGSGKKHKKCCGN